ncbi:MAG: GGDEF domain-containing protein [Pseudomonadota bacterium]
MTVGAETMNDATPGGDAGDSRALFNSNASPQSGGALSGNLSDHALSARIADHTNRMVCQSKIIKYLSDRVCALSADTINGGHISQAAMESSALSAKEKMLFISLLEAVQGAYEQNIAMEVKLSDASREIETLNRVMNAIQTDANTDFLTQLSNRRCFDLALREMIKGAHANDHPLCLIVADIDYFKKINDTWGHYAGDAALIQVATILRNNIKGQDLLARHGGEEFAIALPYITLHDAQRLAEKIRKMIGDAQLHSDRDEPLPPVTMSFGVATLESGDTAETLFKKADAALYNAKQSGRNCVKAHQSC